MMEMENNKNKLLGIGEVAQILGVHADTLRKWDKKGILTSVRIGKRGIRRYRVEDINNLIEANTGK